jgi:peptidoglycan L-alanyl-D-glutamate endopeptidase CwlK
VIASRNLEDLLAHVATRARGLIAEVENRFDIELRVTSTYRDFEEQARLYQLGRTVKGANVSPDNPMGGIITYAEAGESWHNWRRAFDVVPVRAGICLWDDAILWDDIGTLAPKYGLEWGGSWAGRKKDRPHFQFTDGLRLVDLLAMHPEGLK